MENFWYKNEAAQGGEIIGEVPVDVVDNLKVLKRDGVPILYVYSGVN